jgi:predicted metal-dependent hydrolase
LPILQHQSYTIEYEITQRRTNQKNIILRVKGERVLVSAPKYATLAQIESTLKKHVTWIIKKLQLELKTQEATGDPAILKTVDYRGDSLQIVIMHEWKEFEGLDDTSFARVSAKNPVFLSFSRKKLYVYTPSRIDKDVPEMNAYLHDVIYQKLFQLAEATIPDHVTNLGKAHHLLPQRVIVKEQKSRWGSCSTNGSIYMNWRLIQSPVSVLDYVSIHELAHLQEHNHSARFWQLVESMMPDYREQRKWLKENGNQLFTISRDIYK